MTNNAFILRQLTPSVKLNNSHLALLRRIDSGERIVSTNGGAFRNRDYTTFSERGISALQEAGIITFAWCGPNGAVRLELTERGYCVMLDNPVQPPVNPWAGTAYGQIYAAMRWLNSYALRRLKGKPQTDLLDKVQRAMNRTDDGAKLAALANIRAELEVTE